MARKETFSGSKRDKSGGKGEIGLYGRVGNGDIFRPKGDTGLYERQGKSAISEQRMTLVSTAEQNVDMMAWAGMSTFDVHLGFLMST